MKLADNIYSLRKSKGLSQEKLAERINVSRQTISNWELGETLPNPEQLIMLSDVFEKSIDELVGNEIKSDPKQAVSDNTKTTKLIYTGFIIFFGLISGVCADAANRFQIWEIFAVMIAGGIMGAALAAVTQGIMKFRK